MHADRPRPTGQRCPPHPPRCGRADLEERAALEEAEGGEEAPVVKPAPAKLAKDARFIATGKRKPPKGYTRTDFQVTTLAEVMKAFPRTPINIEIKGRTKKEEIAEYVKNADYLAAMLKKTGNAKRKDIVVVSFKQDATDHFHTLLPKVPLAPGTGGASNFLLASMSPGAGVQVFQLPMTYLLSGTLVDVATEAFIKKVHDGGYAWHSWFGDNDTDGPAGWDKLVTLCVDGIMTARPVALEKFLKAHKPPAACKL